MFQLVLTRIIVLPVIFTVTATSSIVVSSRTPPSSSSSASWSIDSILSACRSRFDSNYSTNKENNAHAVNNNSKINTNSNSNTTTMAMTTMHHRVCVLYDDDTHRNNSTNNDSLLDPDEVVKLDHMIHNLENTYAIRCTPFINATAINIQLAMVIVPKMSREDASWLDFIPSIRKENIERNAEQFATTIQNVFGVGNRCGNNNKSSGIVLFVSVEDRAMYVSTSAGVQAILTTDRLASLLKDKMKPYLQQDDGRQLYPALWTFVISVEEYFASGPPSLWKQHIDIIWMLILFLVFGVPLSFKSNNSNNSGSSTDDAGVGGFGGGSSSGGYGSRW